MKKTITESDFKRYFKDYNREDNFSSYGLTKLYEYLIEIEEETGQEMELDVIAICCEFTEFQSIEDLKKEYDVDSLRELENETDVVCFEDDCILFRCY